MWQNLEIYVSSVFFHPLSLFIEETATIYLYISIDLLAMLQHFSKINLCENQRQIYELFYVLLGHSFTVLKNTVMSHIFITLSPPDKVIETPTWIQVSEIFWYGHVLLWAAVLLLLNLGDDDPPVKLFFVIYRNQNTNVTRATA